MRRLLILTIAAAAFGSSITAYAQRQLDRDRYAYPVLNVAGLCSANFGEMRPNHFHSGIDIKTDGVEGKPIAATAEGYIARIVVSPGGYGRALYVVHPEGTMSVYGHMSRFRSDLDSLISDRRYRSKRNAIDIYLPEGKYPVGRGDIIGFSGNTGNSFGPHLHFEIRDMRDNSTLNLIRQGVIPVRDTISPRIEAIHYVAADTVASVPAHSEPRSIAIRQTGKGRYEAVQPVKAAAAGFFIIEVSDRKNDVNNRFGIYRITQKVDGNTVFEYRADGFRIEDSRYCNSISYYPKQLSARCEVIRLARQEGCPDKFFTRLVDRGVLKIGDGQRRHVAIEVEDDCRNVSTLEFDVIPGGSPAETVEEALQPQTIVRRSEKYYRQTDNFSISMPAGTLYETAAIDCRLSDITPSAGSSAVDILTEAYDVADASIPLHKAATVAIRAFVPADMQKYAAMAIVSPNGKLSYAGGKYINGAIEAQTRRLGTFCAVIDNVAPVIRPRFENGSDLRRRTSVTFAVSDNFSGIKDYAAYIDNQWVPLDYSSLHGTFTLRFDHRNYPYDARHSLTVTATDNCGNKAVWEGNFYR